MFANYELRFSTYVIECQALAGGGYASLQRDMFVSCLHLLEIHHDPKLRWRRWLQLDETRLRDMFREYMTKNDGKPVRQHLAHGLNE